MTTLRLDDSDTMSVSLPDPIELPTEILEQILLHLPGQDVIKVEVVWRVTADSRWIIVDFTTYDLGQPAFSGRHS